MTNIIRTTLILTLLCSIPLRGLSMSDDLKIIRERIIESNFRPEHNNQSVLKIIKEELRSTSSPDVVTETQREDKSDQKIRQYLSTMTAQGSWDDINYKDTRRSSWSPTGHVQRMLVMAGGYSNKQSRYYQSTDLRDRLLQALDFWNQQKLVCLNWWYNQIGIPKILGPVLLILEEELSDEQRSQGIAYMKNAKIAMTGQNRVWLSFNLLMRALLEKDEALAAKAIAAIKQEIVVSSNEGIQKDWSFHQHGAQPQFGNYGLAYITTMTQLGRIFSQTKYALDQEQIDILRNLIVEGTSRVVWKQHFDVSSCGRQLFQSSLQGKAIAYGRTLLDMMFVDGDNGKLYESIYRHNILGQKSELLNGYKHFYRSDFSVFRTDRWFASMKMSSERVIAAELVNDENLRGYNLSDGALMLYNDGKEYVDIFPVWRWQLIPGVTTVYQNEGQFQSIPGGYRVITNKNTQAGGIGTTDSQAGLSAMNIDKKGVKANKSWFFCNDFILCMASGITSDDQQIRTSVNQTLLRGAVKEERQNGWVRYTHAGMRYSLCDTLQTILTHGPQRGRWNDIVRSYLDTTTLSKDVFNLCIDHGKAPRNASYAYFVEPFYNRASQKAIDKVRFIRCDNAVHAVQYTNNLYGVVFFEAATATLGDLTVCCSAPAVVLLQRNANGTFTVQSAATTAEAISLNATLR